MSITPMLQRLDNAYGNFRTSLMEYGEISEGEAEKVMNLYLKLKVAKIVISMGRIDVKHGVYLEKDVIQNALVQCK